MKHGLIGNGNAVLDVRITEAPIIDDLSFFPDQHLSTRAQSVGPAFIDLINALFHFFSHSCILSF